MDGFSYNFEIYTGQEENIYSKTDLPVLGATGNVVVRLCKFLTTKNHKIYFDNYYTLLPLLVYLYKEKCINTLGTFRRNLVPDLPLTSEKNV